MEISGVSTGVVASTAQKNGDTATSAEAVRKTLEVETQTQTQTTQAVSQPTQTSDTNNNLAKDGRVGTQFNASA